MTTTVEHGFDTSGTTTERPASPNNGAQYFDTTLGCMLFYDEGNATWRTASGVAVADIGSEAGTGVTINNQVGGVVRTVLTFSDVEIALTDEAGVVAHGGLKVFDFPAGHIMFIGAVADLDITKDAAGVNDDWDGDFSVGTVVASNNATLATTEQNIIPATATPQASSGATTADGESTATENAIVDGSGTALDAYLNFLVDDADHDVTSTPTNLIVNGTITIVWVNLGDN